MAFLDNIGLGRLVENIKNLISQEVGKVNVFKNIKIDATTLSASSNSDTFELVEGNNITIDVDEPTNKITISSTGGGGGTVNSLTDLGVNATAEELNYVDGVTSNIQTQLNGKASTSTATKSANGLMSSADKTKLDNTNVAYGTCSTAAATAAKVVTISGNTNWGLIAGSRITVKFTATNTAQNPTLNVNNTGAKSIWYNTALITTGSLGYAGTANRPMEFVYDGTQYVFAGWSLDNNSDTKNTAGSTDSSSKLFLIGATSQAANPQTYSHNTAYVGTDGCLYSNNKKVSTIEYTTTEPTANLNNGSVWIA